MSIQPLTLGTSALAPQEREETESFRVEASGLMESARAIRVNNADEYRSAGRFFSEIKSKIKEIEAARVKRVKPLNDTVKLINDDYKSLQAQLEAVLRVVEAPMLAFQREEERKRREAEEAARKERERIEAEARAKAEEERKRLEAERKAAEEARAAAAAAEDPFDAALAEEEAEHREAEAAAARQAVEDSLRAAALAQNAVVAAVPAKVTAAGTSLRKTWKFRIVDAALIPRGFLVPDETALGLVARTEKENANVPGVEFYAVDSIGGR